MEIYRIIAYDDFADRKKNHEMTDSIDQTDAPPPLPPPRLRRELGVFDATMLGLGAIVGTGVFVSISLAAGIAGNAILPAIAIAAIVASCNGLNSAQLAANHPVSGGTYEYGYRYLNPTLGFTAGWMFLAAKSASAATAALGFSGYLLAALGFTQDWLVVPTALAALVILTAVVLTGMKRSSMINVVIVSVTFASLLFFIVAGLPPAIAGSGQHFRPIFQLPPGSDAHPLAALLHATALMFVAYTGYGRIATLGEEVCYPRRTIPRAIILTLLCSMALYIAVATVAIGVVGVDQLRQSGSEQRVAPLEVIARGFAFPGSGWIMAVGAMTAMLGVLLNLILGISRVLLAMGRRRDVPSACARLNQAGTTPYIAVLVTAVVITGLIFVGDVKITWSFSAFTVLVYYSITNLAALRLDKQQRMFPRPIAYAGLVACLFLAFWVEREIWLAGLAMIVAGIIWHRAAKRLATPESSPAS